MNTKLQGSKLSILVSLLLFSMTGYTQTTKTTYDFSTAATLSYGNSQTTWYEQADITIDGTAYTITVGGNGSLSNVTSGGASNSACLKKDGSGGDVFYLKRADGQPFQFYGMWVKHESMNSYSSFYTLPPWYTLTASTFTYQDMAPMVGGTAPGVYTTSAQTISAGTGGITTTSVSIHFQAIVSFWIDDIIVGPVPSSPSAVTTQAVTNINATTATGNGNITSLGSPNPTAYGICWNTTGSPTTSNSVVNKGAASSTGAFYANMTGLSPGVTYYVRAFATNTQGTSYGSQVSFTTSTTQWETEYFEDETAGTNTFTNNGFTFDITGGNFKVASTTGYGWNGTAADNKYVDNSTSILTAAGVIGSFKIQSGTFKAKDLYVFPSEDGTNVANTGNVVFTGKLGGVVQFTQTLSSGSINTNYSTTNGMTYVDFGANSSTTIDELEFEVTGSLRYLEIDAFRHHSTAVVVPTVSSVSVPANKTYKAGENLDFTANFSEAITVNTTGGTPSIPITLDTGGTVNANYVSGSGTTALVFRYTVASGNLDSNGISVGSAISANGGTLQSSGGVNANLTLNSVGSTTGVFVDAVVPTVSSISVSGSPAANATSVSFAVTFSESVTGVDASDFNVDGSGVTGSITGITGSGSSYTVTVGSVSGTGTLSIDLKSSGTGIADLASNAISGGFTSGATHTVDTDPPSASSIAVSGSPATNATSVSFAVTFSESVTGVDASDFSVDGSGVTGSIISITGSGSSYTVTVGSVSGTGTLSIDLNSSGTGITDIAGNAISGGFTAGATHTVDTDAPTVNSFSPADGATDVAINSNLVITFSENINIGSGNILIKKISDNSTVQTIAVTDNSQVSVSGAVATIIPATDLGYNTDYYIQIASTAFADAAGNAYTGISNNSNWNFTTINPVLVTVDDPSVTEGNSGTTNLTFTVSLSQAAPAGGATVDYATSDGTATSGSDYTSASGTLTFLAGETSKTVDVTISGDQMLEANETVTLTLSNATGTNVIISDATGTGTINNDDAAAVTIADVSGNEDNGAITLTATLDHAVQGGFSVDVSTADGTAKTSDNDYTAVSGQTLTFAGTAGETKTFTVTPTADTKLEANETVSVSQSNLAATALAVNITDGAIVTINNDDTAAVTIADVSGNEDNGAITLTATLDHAVQGGFTVDVSTADGTATTADNDYTAVSGQTLTFAGTAGETKTFTVTPTTDTKLEANETVSVSQSNLAATALAVDISDGATVTINNDDAAAVTIADVSGNEDNGAITLTATLDHAVQGGFTVDVSTADGTATTADNDYTAVSGQTLTFTGTAGETQTFTVTPTADTKLEANETVSISQSNLAATSLTVDITDGATVTINNDDAAAVTIADVSGNEDDGAITVTATLDHAVQGGFTVDVSTADGTATTADNDYTAVSGKTLTFAGTAGETQTFSVIPTSDTKVEADETVSVSQSNLAATTLAVDISDGATVTIINDDHAEMDMFLETTPVASGSSVDLGVLTFGQMMDTTFTIQNNGTGDLIISTPIDITGPDASEFSITQQPSGFVSLSGETTFTVHFEPAFNGTKTASISIPNNDSNENPYVLNLNASCISGPSIYTLTPTEVKDTSATIRGSISNDGNVPILAKGFVLSKTDYLPTMEKDQVIQFKDISGRRTFTTPVYPLEPGTKYYYRAYATNMVGTAYGNSMTFTTEMGNQQITLADPVINKMYGVPDFDPMATASSGLPVSYSSSDENVATIVDGMIHITGLGSCMIFADQTGNDQYYPASQDTIMLTVSEGTATISLEGLSTTYNGSPQMVTATTMPEGLAVNITYDGSTTAPTDAGKYLVTATLDDPNFAGSLSDTLVIEKAGASVNIGGLVAVYDGNPHPVTKTTDPEGLVVGITYNDSLPVPADAGTYQVTAIVIDANYAGSATAQLVISKAMANVAFDTLAAGYDGDPKPLTVTTSPEGLNVDITYDGSMAAPSDTGTYAVVATINDPNYEGSASGSYVIAAPGNPTAVDNMAFVGQVKVYPTVTKGVVHVQVNNSRFDVQVFNLAGQKLQIIRNVQNNLELNMANYHPGMYILKIKIGEQFVSKRVIRQ